MEALESAARVARVYGEDDAAAQYEYDSGRLREALIHAVRSVHPSHREEMTPEFVQPLAFLRNFSNIFTLNYDLLLYWILLDQTSAFRDGFGLGESIGGFQTPWKPEAYCNVYNIHGGLHLFRAPNGDTMKRVNVGDGIIDAIAETIRSGHLPIYVAEGDVQSKMSKINSIPYLKHCLDTLRQSEGPIFVFGHSAARNDAHIYAAVFSGHHSAVYFCIHRPTADVDLISGELLRYRAIARSSTPIYFVDSETAHVWG